VAAAELITAAATVVTACGGLVLALATLRTAQRTKITEKVAKSTEAKVDEVHVIVNQRFTDLQRYTEALTRALVGAGVDVPIDQSIGPPLPAPAATEAA
jgi:hypothetical protein